MSLDILKLSIPNSTLYLILAPISVSLIKYANETGCRQTNKMDLLSHHVGGRGQTTICTSITSIKAHDFDSCLCLDITEAKLFLEFSRRKYI